VDDASEDKCYCELESNLSAIGNVKLFRNKRNLGLVRNWNECIRLARGKWLSLLCSDDYFISGGLLRIKNIIQESEPCLVIQAPHLSEERILLKAGRESVKMFRLPLVSGTTWNAKISKDLGGFDEELKYSPDAEYWFRIAASYDILQIRDPIAAYTSHEGNYMWETWRKPDFIDQIRLVASKNAAYFIDTYDSQVLKDFQARAVRDTILTMMGASADSHRHSLFFHSLNLGVENGLAPILLLKAIINYVCEISFLLKLKSAIGRCVRSFKNK
jgi:glycosyltransferase involved in cell wall biosynthesis